MVNAPSLSSAAVAAMWRRDYPMARISSWRAGGVARHLFSPTNAAALEQLAAAATETMSEKPLVVGFGSNLLVRDGGYDGVVVRTAPGLAALRLTDDGGVYADAGVGCPKIARFCAEQGMAAAAFLIGIPGTLGGALAMNAGCHGEDTWRWVETVDVLEKGETKRRAAADFAVGYRRVTMPAELAFIGAVLRFPMATAAAAKEKIKAFLKHRRETQPLASASAGSVFCNPPNDYAGRLIEACGLKGLMQGAACVSEKHANFIVNQGGASAADIETLIETVRRRVAEQTGVSLRTEVRIVGRAA